MRAFLVILLAGALVGGESTSAPTTDAQALAQVQSVSSAQDAIGMLARLPDPLLEKHLADFFATASSEDAGRVLMHIAINAVRPARSLVVPMLSHRDPMVIDRALRALTSIGYGSTTVRQMVERQLADGVPTVAELAAACLGAGDDMRAVPALIERMNRGPASVAGAALNALTRLTRVDFKNDATAWEVWYQSYRMEATQRLAAQADQLNDVDPKKQIAAIQTLSGMRGERQEAVDLIEPMASASNQAVAIAARQAPATLSPSDYTMPTAAEVVAATRPPEPVATPTTSDGVIGYLANRGLFDTWYGLLITAFTGILVLSGVLFLLRTAPVKNVTRRIGRVVIAGTARFVRPITSRIKKGTDRIARSLTQPKASVDPKKPG
jgi:hypothetical protein